MLSIHSRTYRVRNPFLAPKPIVKLLSPAKAAVIPAMSTKKREVIRGGRIMGANIRAKSAREAAQKAVRARAESLSLGDGRLWRARSARSNNRAVHQWWPRLAQGRMQLMQDAGENAAGCHSAATGYADLEARGFAKMSDVPQGPFCAAGAYDQADRSARGPPINGCIRTDEEQ